MAITDAELIRIHKGKSSYILLRGPEYFHLVRLDGVLNEEKLEKLLGIYPCSNERLRKLGIHFSAFKSSNLRGVVIHGSKTGGVIEMWVGADVREYRLEADYSPARLKAFFSGFTVWDRMPPPWKGLEPELISKISWGVNIAAGMCAVYFFFLSRPYKLGALLCIILFLAVLALVFIFPESFTLEEKEAGKKRHRRSQASRGHLLPALFMPACALCIRAITDYTYPQNGIGLMLISAAVIVLLLLGIRIYCKNVRHRMVCPIAVIIMAAFFGSGVGLHLNYIADFTPPQSISASVLSKDYERGSKATSYDCTVELPGGEILKLEISRRAYAEIEVGSNLDISYHEGAFNIPFYRIDSQT